MFVFSWLITALWKPRPHPNKADLFAWRSHLSYASLLLLHHWVKTQSCKDKCFFSLRPTLMKTNADSFTNKLELYLRKRDRDIQYFSFQFLFPSHATKQFFLVGDFHQSISLMLLLLFGFFICFQLLFLESPSDCARSSEWSWYMCLYLLQVI